MDGKKWSDESIVAPGDFDGHPTADEVNIGTVGLQLGQRFLYLYDYGDEWKFTITVEDISEEEPEPITPYIVASKGDGPEQYYW